MEKIKNIEALRFIFAIFIVYFHILRNNLFDLYSNYDVLINLRALVKGSAYIVELFFIISGFFLFKTIDKHINSSVFKFSMHKFFRLWPAFAFSTLALFILSLFGIIKFNGYENFLCLLLCQSNGIVTKVVGINWYVSALFWALLFYFLILKNFSRNIANFLIAIITYFSYVGIVNMGCGRDVTHDFLSLSILRGLAGLGFGYLLGMLIENIRTINFQIKNTFKKKISFLVISFVEFYCLIFLLNNFAFHIMSYKNVMIYVFTFSILLILFVFKKGLLSNLLNNDISVCLGKYAYSIYVMQQVSFYLLKISLWKYQNLVYTHVGVVLFISLLFSVLVGILVYHLIEKPCSTFLKNKLT